jgi:hypothetical protein
MEEEIMVVAIVFLGCFTGIAVTAIRTLAARPWKSSDRQRLEGELAAMRREMNDLRSVQNDLVLTLDSTVQRHDALLQSLERRALNGGDSSGDAVTRRHTGAEAEALEVRTRG